MVDRGGGLKMADHGGGLFLPHLAITGQLMFSPLLSRANFVVDGLCWPNCVLMLCITVPSHYLFVLF